MRNPFFLFDLHTPLRIEFSRVVLFCDVIGNVELIVLVSHLVVEKRLQDQFLGEIQLLQLVHILHELLALEVGYELIEEDLLLLGLVLVLKPVDDSQHLFKLLPLHLLLEESLFVILGGVLLQVLLGVFLYQRADLLISHIGRFLLKYHVIAPRSLG